MSTERISSCSTDSEVAGEQIQTLLNNCPELNNDKLLVITADSHYSNQYFLSENTHDNNLVTITRSRSNRVFYLSPKIDDNKKKEEDIPYGMEINFT